MRSLAIFFLLGASVVSAQMTIRPNSSVYVDDVVLYVDQGIDIQNTGNLYLRRDAQLLQSRTKSASTNSGTGTLSVYQEGTSDGYDYNYWCAPVGVADGTNGNRPFSLAQIYQPVTVTSSILAATTSGLNGSANPLTISSYWIWTFVTSANYSEWVHAGTGAIAPGLGFTMKGTDGADATTILGVQNNNGIGNQRYDFRGRPNDANIAVNVANGQWTLTGNPYPSALFVDAFLLDPSNTAINAAAYYWEHQKNVDSHFLADYQGGYGTYVPGTIAAGDGVYTSAFINTYNPDGSVNVPGMIQTGLSINRDYAPIGQGFMIEGVTSGTVTLRNAHREYYRESQPLSTFERSANPGAEEFLDSRLPHIRLNAVIDEAAGRELALILVPFATDGLDRGLEGKSPDGSGLPKDAAFILDDEFYTIQGVAFDIDKRVPLVVKSNQSSMFSFSMPAVVNFDPFQSVYIYDALDGSYHSLNDDATYEVMVPQGTHSNRFEVTFRDAALGTHDFDSNTLQIVQNNIEGHLVISNPQGLELKKCRIYDMAGRLVMHKADLGTALETRLATIGLSEAVYIVKVSVGDKDFGQKISVYRPK
jgi:hypothetical protein